MMRRSSRGRDLSHSRTGSLPATVRMRRSELALGRSSAVEELVNILFHRRIHLDQRRPGTVETFSWNFLHRVDAEFASSGDFARGVIKRSEPAKQVLNSRWLPWTTQAVNRRGSSQKTS